MREKRRDFLPNFRSSPGIYFSFPFNPIEWNELLVLIKDFLTLFSFFSNRNGEKRHSERREEEWKKKGTTFNLERSENYFSIYSLIHLLTKIESAFMLIEWSCLSQEC